MQPVSLKNHLGETLSGSLHRSATAGSSGFVLGHCFTCSRHTRILIDLSNTMAELGYTVLRFDFSGNGQSDGRFEESTYTKQIAEMSIAVDYLKENKVDHVFIGGHSMGAMVSLFTAAKRNDIDGVIALALGEAPLHPDRLLTDSQKAQLLHTGSVDFASRGRDLVLTRKFFDDAARYDLKAVLSHIPCPALIILAADDTVTDPDPLKRLIADIDQPIDWIEIDGADHMFSSEKHRQVVMEHITRWTRDHFSGGN